MKISAREGGKVSREEEQNMIRYGKNYYLDRIRNPGLAVKQKNLYNKNSLSLEYWGLPQGICD